MTDTSKLINITDRPELPKRIDSNFFRKLIIYIGGDPAPIRDYWGWKEFLQEYTQYKKQIGGFVETATTGDPAGAAVWMVRICGSGNWWARRIIERDTTGDPVWAARCMMVDFGIDRRWAEKVVENAKTGNPLGVIYHMVKYHGSDIEWAERVDKKWRAR